MSYKTPPHRLSRKNARPKLRALPHHDFLIRYELKLEELRRERQVYEAELGNRLREDFDGVVQAVLARSKEVGHSTMWQTIAAHLPEAGPVAVEQG